MTTIIVSIGNIVASLETLRAIRIWVFVKFELVLGQLVDDVNGSLELRFLFLGYLLSSEPSTTPLGPAVHPFQVLALPEDTSVQAIGIHGTRWE